MEEFLKHMVHHYVALGYDHNEEVLLRLMEADMERAQVLFDAGSLMIGGRYKEGLQKIVDYMNRVLLNAGIVSERERLEIIRNAVINTIT